MVFDPSAAPTTREPFLAWFHEQTEWDDDSIDYNDPATPSSLLQAWFHEMIAEFPPMNGPLASDDPDDPKVSDYCLARGLIYIAFAYSQAQAAHARMRALAASHQLGFFDVGAEEIWVPEGGALTRM